MFQFEGNQICSKAVGIDFNDFRNLFCDDERAFGFVRIQVRWSFCCLSHLSGQRDDIHQLLPVSSSSLSSQLFRLILRRADVWFKILSSHQDFFCFCLCPPFKERWRDEQTDQIPFRHLAGTERQHDEASPFEQWQGPRQGNHYGKNWKRLAFWISSTPLKS